MIRSWDLRLAASGNSEKDETNPNYEIIEKKLQIVFRSLKLEKDWNQCSVLEFAQSNSRKHKFESQPVEEMIKKL